MQKIFLLVIILSIPINSQSNKSKSKELRQLIINNIDSSLNANPNKKFELLLNFADSKEFDKLKFSTRLKYTEQLLSNSTLPESDSTIIFHKLNVGLFNGYIGNYEISLNLLQQIIKETSTSHLWKIYAEALSAISYIYKFQNKMEKAFNAGEKLLSESILLKDLDYEYNARMFLGDRYRDIGKEEKSIPHYYKADEIAELQNNSEKLDRTKSKIGKLLHLASEDSLSILYHKKALKYAELTNNKKRIYYLKNYISNLSPQSSIEEKINTTKDYLSNIILENHLTDASRENSRLAKLYFDSQKYDEAQITSKQAIKYAIKGNDYNYVFRGYLFLSKSKLEINEIDSSVFYLNKAKRYLKEDEFSKSAYEYYDFGSYLNFRINNYKSAYLFKNKSEKYFKISNDAQTKKKLAINFARYEFDKEKEKALEIEQSKNDTKLAERNFIILSLAGVLLTIFIALFYSTKISKERKKNLLELNEKNEFIENQKNDLDELNKMKDKFFSVIAHDLRGPIGNIMRLSKIVLLKSEENGDEENIKIGGLLNKSSQSVNSLLQSLLLWGKLKMNVVETIKTKYIIVERVNEIANIYNEIAEEKNISIKISVDKNHVINVDEGMIDTVFRNLIHNAIKFSKENGEVTVKSYKVEKFIKIEVSDNGIGIDQNVIDELLNKSENKKTISTNRKSGLGLILAKEFVELNDGSFSIESKLSFGTKISISLPTI